MKKDVKKLSVICPKCKHGFKTGSMLDYICCNNCTNKFHKKSNLKKKDAVE